MLMIVSTGDTYHRQMEKRFCHLSSAAELRFCKPAVVSSILTGGSNGTVPEWLKGKRCKRFDVMSTAVRICPVPQFMQIEPIKDIQPNTYCYGSMR